MAAEGSQDLSIKAGTGQGEGSDMLRNTSNSEAEVTETKAETPVTAETVPDHVTGTSSQASTFSKGPSKRQRSCSDMAPAFQAPTSKFRGVTKHRRSGRQCSASCFMLLN